MLFSPGRHFCLLSVGASDCLGFTVGVELPAKVFQTQFLFRRSATANGALNLFNAELTHCLVHIWTVVSAIRVHLLHTGAFFEIWKRFIQHSCVVGVVRFRLHLDNQLKLVLRIASLRHIDDIALVILTALLAIGGFPIIG